jgi:putative peptidoglycan lipid II flippase
MSLPAESNKRPLHDIQDNSKSLVKAVTHFFSGTALSRLSGMARDMLMAFAFGAEPIIAAFMIAFRFSNLLRRMFGEGAMQSAFTPLFEEIRREGFDRATHFFKELLATLTLFLLGLVVIVEAGLLIAQNIFHFSEDNLEIIKLTAVMFPGIVFICLYGLNAAFLQCQNKFFVSSAAPIAFNIIWIVAVLLFKNSPLQEAVLNLSYAVVIAYFFQWAILLPKVMPLLAKEKLQEKLKVFSTEVKRLLKPLSLGIIAVSAAQINSTVDPLFARIADLQGPAYLWYAIRLQQLPLALLGIAFSGALLPALSRAVKSNDKKKYIELLNYGLKKVLSLMIPITFATFALGLSSVSFLFGRGDFTDNAIIETTYCLWGYGLGIVPMTLVLLFSSAAFANSRFAKPAKAAFLSMFLNILLNALFVFVFKLSAVSVAIATSLSAFFNCFLMSSSAPFKEEWRKGLGVFKTLFASLAAFLMTVFFGAFVLNEATLSLILKDTNLILSRSFLDQAINLSTLTLVYVSALILVGKIIKANDLLALFKLGSKKRS